MNNNPGVDELTSLQNENRKIEKELKELGTTSQTPPIDTLFETAKILFQAQPDISIKKFQILGDRLKFEALVSDYPSIEKIDKLLKKHREIFCRYKRNVNTGSFGQPDKREVEYETTLCTK